MNEYNFEDHLTDEMIDALLEGGDNPIQKPDVNSALGDIQKWLTFELLCGRSVVCPLTSRQTKFYPRRIEGQWMIQLNFMAKHEGSIPSKEIMASIPNHVASPQSGMRRTFQLMRHWGLIEATDDKNCYKITPFGKEFLDGQETIPQMVVLFDNKCQFTGGPQVYWYDAFKYRFSLDEIMDTSALHNLTMENLTMKITSESVISTKSKKGDVATPFSILCENEET